MCIFLHYFDSEYNYYCTIDNDCPIQYPKRMEEQDECVKNNIEEIVQDILATEKNEIQKGKDAEIKFYDSFLQIIESNFISGNLDLSKIENGDYEYITTEKVNITLTTSSSQKNNTNNTLTTIDLEHCEVLLREFYHIPDVQLIYIKKLDIKQEGMKIPKIEYDVYYKLNETYFEKLNLSICNQTKLSLSIPVEIDDLNLDKLNTSSDYFNDICYKAKSDTGTDILLKDRGIDFVENNKTVCQDYCDFSEYDSDNKKANCSCFVKESPSSYEDMHIDKTQLYENFDNTEDRKHISNLDLTSCDVLSSIDNIKSNTGFYLLLCILAIFILIFIIFCSKGYNLLEKNIDDTIYKKFNNKNKNKKNKGLIINTTKIQTKNTKRKKHKNKTFKTKGNNNSLKSIIGKTSNNNLNKIINKNISENKPDTDYELNWLSYSEALRFDKRECCEYYTSLIKSKQLFIFTFCSFNDYNSGILKKFILFLSFALHYTINALFFTEANMHQIYEDEGKYNFEYQLTYIIISAVASTLVIRLMLQFLVLTDKDALEVKLQQTKELAEKMKIKKLKCMKIKFGFFFVLNFILLGLFWYYLTCFNAIYENTQIYLIENTCISFGFSLVYPFVINIFPSIIRMCAIHSSNKNHDYLYKLSKIFQII